MGDGQGMSGSGNVQMNVKRRRMLARKAMLLLSKLEVEVEYLGYTPARNAHEVAVSAGELGMGTVEFNRKIQTLERRLFDSNGKIQTLVQEFEPVDDNVVEGSSSVDGIIQIPLETFEAMFEQLDLNDTDDLYHKESRVCKVSEFHTQKKR